jgi:hypothetical protein
MPGYYTRIYGWAYQSFFAYRTYTVQHPSVVQTEAVYTNYGTPPLGAWNLRSRQIVDARSMGTLRGQSPTGRKPRH